MKFAVAIALGIAATLCFVIPASAWNLETVADTGDLEAIVDIAWTNNSLAKIIPPGDFDYNNTLGVIAYEEGFDTNFLAALLVVTNGTGTNTFLRYPVEVIETTNGSDRVRYYMSAISTNPTAVHTTTVSIANYPEDWIEEVYGEAPEWLSGAALQQWYDDRDPWRQHVYCDLIATSSIPDYVAWLTNSIPVYSDGTNTNSLLTIYSNDIAFVQIESGSGGIDIYLHAPTNVPTLDLFKSTNLLETYGWTLPATLDHTIDPILWTYTGADSPAFFASGNAAVDTDGDGLADIREIRMHGTSIYLADTDGDGLSDGDEILTYGLNALSADSDGDGISDADEVAAGTNPGAADSDGDGITDYGELYTYFGHVDPMDADSDDDGLNDYAEILTHGTYAAPDVSAAQDTDGDDLSDYAEVVTHSTDPLLADTDGDGIDDDYEIYYEWDPNDPGDASEDEDEDGFDNLTEYQWMTSPTSSNTWPYYLSLITRNPGTNSIRRMETINYQFAVGDLGDRSALVRVRPHRQGTNTAPVDLRLHHSQAEGIYINGTEASSMSTPIEVAASTTATEYKITADPDAAGTNLYFELTDTNDNPGIKCTARFYAPKLYRVEFNGPGNEDVLVNYGETNTLWLAMPADTNACRVYMYPNQTPGQGYGIPYFHWTDWPLVKVTGSGAVPSENTINRLDWQSAYGSSYSDADTQGIKLDTGTYTFDVGLDYNANATLEAAEVQETCLINVIDLDADVDTNNDGDIDEGNTGEDAFEQYAPGVIICETLHGGDTNADHLVELKLSFEPASLTTGTVYIAASSGGSRIKLWTDTNSTSEVTLPASYDLSFTNPPTSLWIDGVDTGEAVIDFYFKSPDNDEIMRDKVAVYVTRTPSWGPFSAQGYAYSWQPCAWGGAIWEGQGTNTHNTVVDNIVSQGWDVLDKKFIDDSAEDDDYGDCTLANFRDMRYAPIAAVSTHGSSASLHAVYATSSNAIASWINAESGISPYEWEDAGMWSARVSSDWIAQNWNVMGFDYRRAITMFMTCNGATGGTNSLVARAGGRAAFGYATEPSHPAMRSNNNRLFGRMNGTEDSATLRPATEAYAGGAGYSASLTMFGNGWSTLCPAPVAFYPDADPGQRKGWGCIIFDTYMDDTISATDALTMVAGGAAVTNVRWLGNGSGSFALGFDFDNCAGGGLTLRANADKCLHSGSGWGRELDGNGVQPNGDDPPDWP